MRPCPGLRVHFIACCLISVALCFLIALPCVAAGPDRVVVNTSRPQKLTLTVGKSTIVECPQNLKRVSIAAPDYADILTLSPRQIYLTGKMAGNTNLTLWRSDNSVMSVIDVEVLPDVVGLKEKIHSMMPDEKDIRVTATPDAITLSGTVSSAANMNQVLSLANSYAPKSKDKTGGVNNFLEVGGVHQVMLEVRVSEMSRSLIKKLGINWNYLSEGGNTFGMSLLDNLTYTVSPSDANIQPMTHLSASEGAVSVGTLVSSSVGLAFRFFGGGATWTLFIDAMKDQGLLKVLAEPTLLTLSGKTASFLAGGEFPIPVPQEENITIEYKPFGVGLNFTPTVLSNKKISMQVSPEVSDLDYTNAVAVGGYAVPSITTRRVATTVELADGQSFAIAGLLKDDIRQIVRKVPLLGDIPVLGSLFRSSQFRKNETELVIIVTPRLVKPLDMTKQTLPTDQYVEPNDFEFYLLGSLEGKRENDSATPTPVSSALPGDKTGGLEGDFGYIRP